MDFLLENLYEAHEKFDELAHQLVENCLDANTKTNFTREITLKVKVRPNDDRRKCSLTVDASSKLAPYKKDKRVLFVDVNQNGEFVGRLNDPRQTALFDEGGN